MGAELVIMTAHDDERLLVEAVEAAGLAIDRDGRYAYRSIPSLARELPR